MDKVTGWVGGLDVDEVAGCVGGLNVDEVTGWVGGLDVDKVTGWVGGLNVDKVTGWVGCLDVDEVTGWVRDLYRQQRLALGFSSTPLKLKSLVSGNGDFKRILDGGDLINCSFFFNVFVSRVIIFLCGVSDCTSPCNDRIVVT